MSILFVIVSYPRLKKRVAYIVPNPDNLASVLESVRVSDTALFLWSLQDSIDDTGEKLYSCLFAQGLPATAHAVMVTIYIYPKVFEESIRYLTWE